MSSSSTTKNQIGMALKELMITVPLHEITIKQIADKCGIKRQTFYYHFDDIFDALDWFYVDETSRLLAGISDIKDWKKAVTASLYYIKENEKICMNAYNSLGFKQMRNILYKNSNISYTKATEKVLQGSNVDPKFLNFFITLLVYATQGSLLHWLENGMKESPEQIVEWIGVLVEGNFGAALEKVFSSLST